MKQFLRLIYLNVIIALLLTSPLFAEEVKEVSKAIVEPVFRLNISPIKGASGSGMVRGLITYEEYDFQPSNTIEATNITFKGEFSFKLIEQVGIGVIVPYHIIENANLLSSGAAPANRDEDGLGNIVIGAHVLLPPPKKGAELIIGANSSLPTADDDIGRKISSVEPYAIIQVRDGDISLRASAGYEIIIDEQAELGLPEDILDDIFTLQGSAMYSASDVIAVGAQLIVTTAENTLFEFVPQIRVDTETLNWGVAVTIPISNDHPQISSLEKSYEFILHAALRF
jgi:hypothetical protein